MEEKQANKESLQPSQISPRVESKNQWEMLHYQMRNPFSRKA